jgi:hypothetical protein
VAKLTQITPLIKKKKTNGPKWRVGANVGTVYVLFHFISDFKLLLKGRRSRYLLSFINQHVHLHIVNFLPLYKVISRHGTSKSTLGLT